MFHERKNKFQVFKYVPGRSSGRMHITIAMVTVGILLISSRSVAKWISCHKLQGT